MKIVLWSLTSLAFLTGTAFGDVVIKNAWLRAMPPELPTTSAYLEIQNQDQSADKLLQVTSDVATSIEFHETVKSGGMATMKTLTNVTIPKGKTITFGPGGLHLMVMGLKKPLEPGQEVPLSLIFEKAGTVKTIAKVRF